MDFNDTPEEAQFRADARAWLQANAAPKVEGAVEVLEMFEDRNATTELVWVQDCRAWQATKHAGGYGAVAWPREHGGRDGTQMEQIIFDDEEGRFDVAAGAFTITLGMIAPTIIAHGTPAQREHVVEMLSGREVWCQLFSEPNAGSDLANIQTRAVRDGDDWIVNGQKVWTSGAHYADWGYLLTSTGGASQHHGMTAFMLPMDTAGVEVRPLRQMTGGANFNEVFLADVRIPDEHRVGEVGEGWGVARTTLMNERVAAASQLVSPGLYNWLEDLASQLGHSDDLRMRQRLAQLYTLMQVRQFTNYRALTAISQGSTPGPEGSIGKLAAAQIARVAGDLVMSILGQSGMLTTEWTALLLSAPGLRLGGGTDEIMRNIIAERVLGLPREPRTVGEPKQSAPPASGLLRDGLEARSA